MLAKIFEALGQKREANRQAILTDLRTIIQQAALAEVEGRAVELTDQQMDVAVALCEAEGLTNEDFRANVAERVRYLKATALAGTAPAKMSESMRLETEAKQFAEWLWAEHNRNLKRHQAMEMEAATALSQYMTACSADAGSASRGTPSAEENRLSSERQSLVEKIAELHGKLRQSRPWWMSASLAPSADQQPGAMLFEAERELRSGKCPDHLIKAVRQTVEVAKAAVAKCNADLAAHEKQVAAIDARLRRLAAERPFDLIRTSKGQPVYA